MAFWLALTALIPQSRASLYIDDPALLYTASGGVASNDNVVSLLLGFRFLRYDPLSTDTANVQPVMVGSSPVKLAGPTTLDDSPLMGSKADPVATTLPLREVPATGGLPEFQDGEAVFFSAQYPFRANDPFAIDSATVRVRVLASDDTVLDSETLRIFETGPATGLFVGYLQHDALAGGAGDGRLSLPAGSRVEIIDEDDLPAGGLLTAALARIGPPNPFNANLYVTKTVSQGTAAPGDFLQYRVQVENATREPVRYVLAYDVLPRGFRYVGGSLRQDGVAVPDPQVDRDGRTMRIVTNRNLAPGDHIELSYVVEVTAGARPGQATNTARATADNGVASNVAGARVQVREDLFRSSGIVVGRVMQGRCDAGEDAATRGVANVRLYLEDGRTVLTDKFGRYHVAGLAPGTHVMQLDPASLPTGLEPVACNDNTRIAGNAASQFVDVQPGSLWRVNFNLGKPGEAPPPVAAAVPAVPEPAAPPAPRKLALQLSSEVTDTGFLHYTIAIDGNGRQKNVSLVIDLANGLQVAKGSIRRDGNEIAITRQNGVRHIDLGDIDGNFSTRIEFDALTSRDDVEGLLKTMAWLVSDDIADAVSVRAANVASIGGGVRGEETRFSIATHFPAMSAELSPVDRLKLDEVVDKLRDLGSPDLVVTGHSDDTRIATGGKRKPAYADNYVLSRARAESVALYLRDKLALAEDAVSIIGAGPDKPVASNKTPEGRAKNRRVDVAVRTRTQDEAGNFRIISGDSERRENVVEDAPAKAVAGAAPGAAATPAAGATTTATATTGDGAMRLQLASTADDNGFIHYRAEIGGKGMRDNLALYIDLANGLQVAKGSVKRNGTDIALVRENGTRRIALGNVAGEWASTIEFDALATRDDISGEMATTVRLVADGIEKSKALRASNTANISTQKQAADSSFVLPADFVAGTATPTAAFRLRLDELAEKLQALGTPDLVVTGHTDNTPLPAAKGKRKPAFTDLRALSRARAAAVAAYLREKLAMGEDAIAVEGLGATKPVAGNTTAEGRAKNRRIEVKAIRPAGTSTSQITIVSGDSGVQAIEPPAPPAPAAAPAPVAAAAAPAPEKAETTAPPPVPGIQDLQDGDHLAQRIQQVRVILDSRLTPKLTVDGVEVSPRRIGYRAADPKTRTTLYSYIGVDFGDPGDHVLRLTGTDTFGNARVDQTLKLLRTGDIRDVRALEPAENVADGRTPVSLKVELRDGNEHRINASATLVMLEGSLSPEGADTAINPLASNARVVKVGIDGTIRFQPVTQAGRYHVRLAWSERESRDFVVYVKPDFRDWILVGLAEGSIAQRNLVGNLQPLSPGERDEGLDSNGRIAFFAKGKVQGKWLLTTAYDSAKHTPEGHAGGIDPNAWYTVYGDAAQETVDAPSRRKLYLKLEKENLYWLFGDFDTGMNVTDLSRYSRRLNGVKTEYWGERTDVLAFTSETQQAFRRSELRGDGTSGLYHLGTTFIVPDTEEIRIVVRDRFNAGNVVDERPLARYIDYSIDYDSGAIWFKEPVRFQDDALNPVYIVATYEIDNGIGDTTAGLRVVTTPTARTRIGVTGVREGAGVGSATLAGVDATVKIDEHQTLTLEAANTSNDMPTAMPSGTAASGNAALLKHEYRDTRLQADSYIRETGTGFGLGQQSATTDATRSVGSEVRYTFDDHLRGEGRLSRDEQLDSGATRDLAEAHVSRTAGDTTLTGGVRAVQDNGGAGSPDSQSLQLLGGAQQKWREGRLTTKVEGETNVGEDQPDSADYPHRLRAGVDYRLTPQATVYATQEWAFGKDQDSQHSLAGLRYMPWKGAQLNTSLGRDDTEYGPRIYASSGLVQNWQIDGHWSADAGLDRVDTLAEPGRAPFDPDVAPTNGDTTEDFVAVFLAAGYQDEAWRWRGRIENRNGRSEDKSNLYTSIYRRLDEADSLGASLRVSDADKSNGDSSTDASVQFDLAHRPLSNDEWILLDQVRYAVQRRHAAGNAIDGHRLVNNLNANWQATPRDQVGLQYGAKYVFDTIDDRAYKGYTDLVGVEYRHDVSREWDVGIRSSVMHSWRTDAIDESWGLFAGWSPDRNVWISAGWNFKGFRDNDFTGANYRDVGFNLALRVKFDQQTARDLGKRMAPRSHLAGPRPDPGEDALATE